MNGHQQQASMQGKPGAATPETVIVGLGATGMSVARYLDRQGRDFAVVDSRSNPPNAQQLHSEYGHIPSHFGSFRTDWFRQAKCLVVNPGIAIATPELRQAAQQGVELIGDIELFAREVGKTRPVIAITGSNGKTTVTRLVDRMAQSAGIKVATGGNIGTPALDLLQDATAELYVLELSSYQLETTTSLHTVAAVILNISEDHLDRYNNDIADYAKAKSVIYQNCDHVIFNREDSWSRQFAGQAEDARARISFGLNEPQGEDFGLRTVNGREWLVKGAIDLMPADQIKLPGKHNLANALAAIALGDAAGIPMDAMLDTLREFAGIEHRTQWVRELDGVNWYNDSKGTNVGATLAALSGLPGKTVLIAGGQGKGADFFPLAASIRDKARAVILMGEDAEKIAAVVDKQVPVVFVKSMMDAVKQAQQLADSKAHDNVLLSPACASFDMFANYEQRGQSFIDAVNKLNEVKQHG